VRSSVVIVNWNSGGRLKRCLESLPADAPTVVVDNASEDDSIELARSARPDTTFIRNSSNRGLSAGLNQGFAATAAPYVLVLNPDITVTPTSVDLLERDLEAHARAGAVGGYVNEKYLPRPLATPWTIIRENFGLPVSAPEQLSRDERSECKPGRAQPSREVGQAAAAALLVRREAYVAAGGFDERFVPAWYEDVDFCKSLSRAGWEVRFCREAEFVHEGGYSARAMGTTAFASAYYRNQLRYVNKHFGAAAGALVRVSIVIGMTGRMMKTPSRSDACWAVISGALGGW
jgi:N-acetylglucosaminyl-diphospho-decaprenol L-rhamnosyltransferase